MSRVEFKNVSKAFNALDGGGLVYAVRDLNLTIEQGEMVTLLGPSGCGKTTTLRMLAGFEVPTAGRIMVGDRDVTDRPVNSRGIGMMFQGYALFPHMTVRQNIAYGLQVARVPKAEITRRVAEVMELMALTAMAERTPSQMSGGQQQRVALARSVVTEPSVLLFDEPLSNLDAQLRERMRDELRSIQQRIGITSLYVTHDQSEALAISDQVVVMNAGLVEQKAPARVMYDHPQSPFVAQFLGCSNIWDGVVTARSDSGYEVRCGVHLVRAIAADGDLSVGTPVAVTLRPQTLNVVADPAGQSRIVRTVFQGTAVEYLVDDGERKVTVVAAVDPDTEYLDPEQRVSLVLPEAPAWCIAAERGKEMAA